MCRENGCVLVYNGKIDWFVCRECGEIASLDASELIAKFGNELLSQNCNVTHQNYILLVQENTRLKKKIRLAIKALKYYAKKENWNFSECFNQFSCHATIYDDMELSTEDAEVGGIDYAGKRARAALKKIKLDTSR